MVLHLAELREDEEQFQTEIDADDNGFGTVGDYVVIEGDGYDRTRTIQVGVTRADCLFVGASATVQTLECDVTFDLDRGLITVEGPIVLGRGLRSGPRTGHNRWDRRLPDGTRCAQDIDLLDEEGFLFKFCLIL